MDIVPQGYTCAREPRIKRPRCNKPSLWFIVGRHKKPVTEVSAEPYWLRPHCICHNDGQNSLGAFLLPLFRHNSENRDGCPGVPIYWNPMGMNVPKGRQYGKQGVGTPLTIVPPVGTSHRPVMSGRGNVLCCTTLLTAFRCILGPWKMSHAT